MMNTKQPRWKIIIGIIIAFIASILLYHAAKEADLLVILQVYLTSEVFDSERTVVEPCRVDPLIEIILKRNLTTGLELGVNRGEFSHAMLTRWPQCTKYYLVDPYDLRPKTFDSVQKYMDDEFPNKPHVFLKMNDREALTHIEDDSLDFIFLDANHDYCSLQEQLRAFWPKLKYGGLFSGHDYVWKEGRNQIIWTLCRHTGEFMPGAVKRAVDEFGAQIGRKVTPFCGYEYKSLADDGHESWYMLKD